jgi:hypothetical protein
MPLPDLHPVRGGPEATCGKCLARCRSVGGSDTEAWSVFPQIGWSLFTPRTGTRWYALCPACTKDRPNVD